MTTAAIALQEYLRKLGMDQDKDFLQESVRVMGQMLRELEVQEQTGAAKHERTPERLTQRNGYRERVWETRVGRSICAFPNCARAAIFPACSNSAGEPTKPCWRWCSKPTWKGLAPARWMISCQRWA